MNKPGASLRKLARGLSLLVLVACSRSDKNAPERNFYFEVTADQKNESAIRLSEYLTNRIAANKYTITNHSGQEWPYYRALKPDEEISTDSLMPPHWFIHKMIPMHQGQRIERDEFLVRIHVWPRPDTIPNYSVEIFMMDSTGLSLSGTAGVHFIDSTEYSSPESLRGYLLKSVLRYSFK